MSATQVFLFMCIYILGAGAGFLVAYSAFLINGKDAALTAGAIGSLIGAFYATVIIGASFVS